MYEWMDRCVLLLEAMVFSLESSLVFFLGHGYPFFSLFLGHASLACHLFSFWGNHNLTLFYFRDVLRERLPRHGAFTDEEWIDIGANSRCRNVASRWGRVRAYDREGMKRFSLGSQNLTKLNRTSSSICIRFFFHGIWHMALVGHCISLGNLPFNFFSKTTPDFKHP